jgi:hypothetical protein
MSIRHIAGRVAAAAVSTAAVGALSLFAFSGAASAAGPTGGSIVPNSAVPVGSFTPGTPFSSGQGIDVVVPANSVFTNPNAAINVVECSAPNGVVPTLTSACDGNTIQGVTLNANSDGSIDFQANTGSLYTVFSLPNSGLGEGSTGPVCGTSAATECILYIGLNQGDFNQPHVWSQPFQIAATPSNTGANPGDGTPEVPMAVLLPLVALGLIGGTVMVRRRRAHAHGAASVTEAVR